MIELLLPIAWAAHAAPAPNAYRERARAVLQTHCGACHDPKSAAANDKALKIYDLSQPEFAAHMRKNQLQQLPQRLEARLTMTQAELAALVPHGLPSPRRPTTNEIETLKAYASIELLNHGS